MTTSFPVESGRLNYPGSPAHGDRRMKARGVLYNACIWPRTALPFSFITKRHTDDQYGACRLSHRLTPPPVAPPLIALGPAISRSRDATVRCGITTSCQSLYPLQTSVHVLHIFAISSHSLIHLYIYIWIYTNQDRLRFGRPGCLFSPSLFLLNPRQLAASQDPNITVGD